MENTSHALHIAVGVLIAIMLTGLVLYVFRAIGRMEKSGDSELVAKNRTEFNESFLAFQKPLMYGTDVLSCLNKAQSNNQKYVYSKYYGKDTTEDTTSRAEYIVDVKVEIKNPINETLKVYYRNSQGKIVESLSQTYTDVKPFSDSSRYKFTVPTVNYYYFKYTGTDKKNTSVENSKLVGETDSYKNVLWNTSNSLGPTKSLKSGTYPTSMSAGVYSITEDNTGKLSALLTTVTTVEQTIVNEDYTSFGDADWYSATWKTAAYDFKTRKFECTGVTYNEDTGYINSISFVEK